MKNKTLATWITLVGGPLGLHRFYLFGASDWLGRLLPIGTVLGLYGVFRAQGFGMDDAASAVLIPLLGFIVSGCALNAIVFGLMNPEKWNASFNPQTATLALAGQTNWLTVVAVVASLMLGTTALLASLAFGFQRYFEFQADDSLDAPMAEPPKKSAD
ncbi:MAG: hypothetical protein K9K38_09490 [Rhodoferax sp.]|nr:hypothetical protein [Rhodoferax sp.]MCF8209620.1 hypothetical protein [Rhodoferax sp.]